MRYIELCNVYEGLNSTSKRLEKIYLISRFLKKLPDKNTGMIVLLMQGRIFPLWEEQKIGVAARTVLKAINVSTGITVEMLEREWKQTGDLGIVAHNYTAKKQQETLFCEDLDAAKVYSNLVKLAEMQGHGTVERRVRLITELLTSAKPVEAKYIIRTILEDLRIGVGEGSIRDAIVWAFFGDELGLKYDAKNNKVDFLEDSRKKFDEYVKYVQYAYNLTNDFAEVISIAKEKGIEGLKNKKMELGKPIKVMLYPKAKDIEDAFKIVGKPAAFEYKYDGFRVQIHYKQGDIELFTRRLEKVTRQFPDVVDAAKKHIKAGTAIIDAEIVGYEPGTNQYLPFQSISQRIKRKHNITEMTKRFPVEIIAFDIVFHDGKSTLQKPFNERRKILSQIIEPQSRKIMLSRIIITSDKDKASDFYNEALDMGEEGIMAKSLDAPYEPGSRVGYGVKLKQVMDALDLVIVEAEWGEGKRANWLTSYTVASIDENKEFKKVGKVSTGLKELETEGVTFAKMTKMLEPLIIAEKGKKVKVKPDIVIEVHYEEIQRSTNYESGYALRFPRFIRLREDRRADEADDIATVEELYRTQRNRE